MIDPALLAALQACARAALGEHFTITTCAPVAGGDISRALRVSGPGGQAFVKLDAADAAARFAAEARGLAALAACPAVRVPSVLGQGTAAGQAFLMLEWLDIAPLREPAHAARAGEALAALHRLGNVEFGWPEDNFIGRTPQANPPSPNWSRFWVEQRLAPQFERAYAQGFRAELAPAARRICDKSPAFFIDYQPVPSLLHGDLWSGNLGALPDGTPVLFDPACYYGDREADVAMTELFGGLPLDFYSAYRAAWPLDDDYERRKPLYNLYHLLNHLNLFGRGYLRETVRVAEALARELSI